MHKIAPLLAAVVALGTACPPQPVEAPLPPAGMAGNPAPAIAPGATMPPGHPPVDNPHGAAGSGAAGAGGDDGAPLPPSGALPLPNLPGLDTVAQGAAGKGAGMGVVFTGTVLEKLDVPSYTYLRVKTASGEEWVAVNTLQVNVGDTVTVNQQLVMDNFASKALGRTFPKLVMGTATVGG